MPVTLNVNGVNYNYPKLGDENWGQDATNWAVAITQLSNSINTLINNTIVSGIYEFGDGNASVPSGRFQNSLTTGFYRVAPNVFGFTAAGVAAGQISASGLLQWKVGSAATPAYSFISDPATGFYLDTPGVIGASGSLKLSSSVALGVTIDPLKSVLLLDNVGTPTEAFSFPASGNQHIIVHFSLVRGSNADTGTLHLVHDGTTATIEGESSFLLDSGVDFTADIDSGNIRILYTTDATGSPATLKYFVFRWGD